MKHTLRARMPRPLLYAYRLFSAGDIFAIRDFLFGASLCATFSERCALLRQVYRITNHVTCGHSQAQLLTAMKAILSMSPEIPGAIIEAGCFKGGGSAKLSLAARQAGRRLYIFDSFEGIPDNTEEHENNIWGGQVKFAKGDYAGALEEVKGNVTKYGAPEVCTFVKGFFDETMPHFQERLSVVYLDVDLVSSTRTCLKTLWPLLAPGGVLFSQDGQLPLVLDLFDDDEFWQRELGTPKPHIHGFKKSQLIWCRKG